MKELIVKLEYVGDMGEMHAFKIAGTSVIVSIDTNTANALEAIPVFDKPKGMTQADAIGIARKFAGILSEELLPLAVDFIDRAGVTPIAPQAPQQAPKAQPQPTPVTAPKAALQAPQAQQKAPKAQPQQAHQPQPQQAQPTAKETQQSKELMDEFAEFGIDMGPDYQGGGKRDTHPFESTTMLE